MQGMEIKNNAARRRRLSRKIIVLGETGCKVLSGRSLGAKDRIKFSLDKLDVSPVQVYIKIPYEMYSVNSSYFLALFGKSIRTLGKDGFLSKYKFECTNIIRQQCIEQGILDALKTTSILG